MAHYDVEIYSPFPNVSAQEIRISGQLPEYHKTSEWAVDAPGVIEALDGVFETSQSDPTDWVVLGEVARIGESWFFCDVLGWTLLDEAPPMADDAEAEAPKAPPQKRRHLSLVK